MKNKKILVFLCVIFSFIFSSSLFAESVLSSATDAVNSGIINTKIATDNTFSNVDVDATVVNGVAVFSGKVSKTQADELVRIARSISGIKGVDTTKLQIVK